MKLTKSAQSDPIRSDRQPGCVNTTELDIKKACRLSKSAKRCAECQKVAAQQQGASLAPAGSGLASPSPELAPAAANAAVAVAAATASVSSGFHSNRLHEEPAAGEAEWEVEKPETSEASNKSADATSDTATTGAEPRSAQPAEPEGEPAAAEGRPEAEEESQGEDQQPPVAGAERRQRPAQPARGPGHAHAHGHAHHHHPHHHHHHHHHHGHHHHHHHHRQCPHHQRQQQQSAEPSSRPLAVQSGPANGNRLEVQRSLRSKKRSAGSVDQFVGPHLEAPTALGPTSAQRRRSECNRMFSLSEVPLSGSRGPPEGEAARSKEEGPTAAAAAGPEVGAELEERPASACCSLTSMAGANQLAESGPRPATTTGWSGTGSGAPPMVRKSSLNILRPPGGEQQVAAGCQPVRKGSVHLQGQRAQLKGTQSVCGTSSGSSQELRLAERQDICELERELEALRVRLERGGVKMSKVTQSYLSYFKQWAEYDPFIAQPIPSNPWQSDSTELWDSERQTKDVHCRRVRRWAFSLKELLSDPAGRDQFHRFLEKEFSAENLK